MAIEDIIWAKNRHMFGGIEPPHMKTFIARQRYNEDKQKRVVEIVIELPDDLTIPKSLVSSGYDASICTIGGVVIRKSETDYPKDENDGELIANISVDGVPIEGYIIDENVEPGKTYYYKSFVYSTQGIWRSSLTAEIEMLNMTYFFGYDLDTTNSDPYARVSYPSDVDNAGYTPAVLNDLKSWNIPAGEKFMPRPCMLTVEGAVYEYLNPNDYTKTVDGSDSTIADLNLTYNAMMEWPKIYTKRWEENGVYHFRCSDVKIDKDYECWCNYYGSSEIDHFYTGIYVGTMSTTSVNSARLMSKSGISYSFGQSANDYRSMATKNGAGWQVENILDHLLIQDLLVMMGHSTNCQNIFGNGGSKSTGTATGKCNSWGLFGSDASYVKVFGMEDYWGVGRVTSLKFAQFGWQISLKGTATYCGDLTNRYDYTPDGYIQKMTTYSWGRLPWFNNDFTDGIYGTATTFECDYIELYTGRTSSVWIGGSVMPEISSYTSTTLGPFRYYAVQYDTHYTNYGCARLACKPVTN